MDILFLGTSSGVPTRQRNVTALALQPENSRDWYLVDCGEATQHRLLRTPLSVRNLKAIFITHVHGDHSYGLPGLLASAAMNGRTEPLVLIGPRALWPWLELTRSMSELYLPYELQFIAVDEVPLRDVPVREVDGAHAPLRDTPVWHDQRISVCATLLSHRVASYGYSFTDSSQEAVLDSARLQADGVAPGAVWGQLKQGRDVVWQDRTLLARDYLLPAQAARKIVVGGDNDQPDLLQSACDGAQVLIHEATYTEDVAAKVGPSVMHSDAARVARFAQHRRVPNLILTHFSPRYQHNLTQSPSIEDIRQEALQHYDGQLWLADDLARYRLNKGGQLQRMAEPASQPPVE